MNEEIENQIKELSAVLEDIENINPQYLQSIVLECNKLQELYPELSKNKLFQILKKNSEKFSELNKKKT